MFFHACFLVLGSTDWTKDGIIMTSVEREDTNVVK